MNGLPWKATLMLIPAFGLASAATAQSSFDLHSPDGRIEIRIRTAKGVRYDVLLKGKALLQDCALSLDIDHKMLGPEGKVLKAKEGSADRILFLGPMDYTPGAMLNAQKSGFAPIFNRPMSLGTRCHQLAMYVVYESPLQMLADSPSNYLREPEVMEFLAAVPTEWDETKVLDARIADYVVVARRNGADWYVGAMTDWTPRELQIDFSFLPEGNFQMDAYQDGANADRFGSDYKMVKSQVNGATRLKIKLAPGGGWAARVHR